MPVDRRNQTQFLWVVAAVLAVAALVIGWVAAIVLKPTSMPPPAGPQRPVPPDVRIPRTGPLPNAWVEPLPPGAIARLGTTAFRHGTDGIAGIGEPAGVWQLAFQDNGPLVSLGGERVRFWDPDTGRELHMDRPPISTRMRWLTRSHFFPGGRLCLIPDAREDREPIAPATVWDLTSRTAVRIAKFAPAPGRKSTVLGPTAVSADGSRFAELDGNGDAWIWDRDGKPVSKLAERLPLGTFLFLSPDGRSAITIDGPHRIRVWYTSTGALQRDFGPRGFVDDEGHSSATAALSPDGRWLVAVSRDLDDDGEDHDGCVAWSGTFWIRDLEPTALDVSRTWPFFGNRFRGPIRLAFAPDSRSFVAAGVSEDRIVRFGHWLVPAGPELDFDWTGNSHGSSFWSADARGLALTTLAIDSKRNRVAAGGQGAIRLFDATAGAELVPADAHVAAVRHVEFVDAEVRSIDAAGEFRRWNPADGTLIGTSTVPVPGARDPLKERSLRHDFFRRKGVTFVPRCSDESDKGSIIAVGLATIPPKPDEVGRVELIDRKDSRILWHFPTSESAPGSVRFSQDGSILAVGTTRVHILDARTGKQLEVFDGHRGAIRALAFDADGMRLISGSEDTTAIV